VVQALVLCEQKRLHYITL